MAEGNSPMPFESYVGSRLVSLQLGNNDTCTLQQESTLAVIFGARLNGRKFAVMFDNWSTSYWDFGKDSTMDSGFSITKNNGQIFITNNAGSATSILIIGARVISVA